MYHYHHKYPQSTFSKSTFISLIEETKKVEIDPDDYFNQVVKGKKKSPTPKKMDIETYNPKNDKEAESSGTEVLEDSEDEHPDDSPFTKKKAMSKKGGNAQKQPKRGNTKR